MHTRTVPIGYSIVSKNIPYAPVKDLDFTSAKGKKNKIDDALAEPSTTSVAKRARKSLAASLSPPEIEHLYKIE